jgi:hypothetical protein
MKLGMSSVDLLDFIMTGLDLKKNVNSSQGAKVQVMQIQTWGFSKKTSLISCFGIKYHNFIHWLERFFGFGVLLNVLHSMYSRIIFFSLALKF